MSRAKAWRRAALATYIAAGAALPAPSPVFPRYVEPEAAEAQGEPKKKGGKSA